MCCVVQLIFAFMLFTVVRVYPRWALIYGGCTKPNL